MVVLTTGVWNWPGGAGSGHSSSSHLSSPSSSSCSCSPSESGRGVLKSVSCAMMGAGGVAGGSVDGGGGGAGGDETGGACGGDADVGTGPMCTVMLVSVNLMSHSTPTEFLSRRYIQCVSMLSLLYPTQCPSMAQASSLDPTLVCTQTCCPHSGMCARLGFSL